MATCAELATQRKILENILRKTGDQKKRQQILDKIDDIEQQQTAQGCLAPPPVSIQGTLNATVTLWTDNSLLPGPKPGQITAVLIFTNHADNSKWSVSIDSLSATFKSGVTARLQDHSFGTGIFDPSSGSLNVDVPLHVENIPLIGSVDAKIHFTTDSSIAPPPGQVTGSTVDKGGNLTLVGAASNIGPFNNEIWLAIVGTLSDWPRG
jgi:hypothetical protein